MTGSILLYIIIDVTRTLGTESCSEFFPSLVPTFRLKLKRKKFSFRFLTFYCHRNDQWMMHDDDNDAEENERERKRDRKKAKITSYLAILL